MNGEPIPKQGKRVKQPRAPVPPEVRLAVLERDRGCQGVLVVPGVECRGELQCHHLWRRGQGGPDEVWNLKAVCGAHHHWIHHNVALARECGLLRRRGQTGP